MRIYKKTFNTDKDIDIINNLQKFWMQYEANHAAVVEALNMKDNNKSNVVLDYYHKEEEKSYATFKKLQTEFEENNVQEFLHHNATWVLDYYKYILTVTVRCNCEIDIPEGWELVK